MTMKKVLPGQKLRIPAAFYNRVASMVNQEGRNNVTPKEVETRLRPMVAQVYNGTDTDFKAFNVAVADDTVITVDSLGDAAQLAWLLTTPVLELVKPTGSLDELNRVCILLEPIKQQRVGLAVIAGPCPVRVDQTSITHGYARTSSNVHENLVSCKGGGILMLGVPTVVTADPTWGLAMVGRVKDPFFQRVRFELDEDLTNADASADATILSQEGPGIENDDLGITALNYLTRTAGVRRWEGVTGDVGLAEWSVDQSYTIIDLQCPE